LKLRCQKCGVETPEGLRFCLNCRASLILKNKYDLSVRDFAYPPDLDAIRTLRAMGALPYLLRKISIANVEKKMVSDLSLAAQKVAHPSDLDAIVRHCATSLSIEYLPQVFIAESDKPNAFTFGSEEQAYLVLNSGILRVFTNLELMAVIAHELGHIKSGHMMYHTIAELLSGGISFSASLMGFNVLSIPLHLALLSWHRESEVTGDRASLLVVNDIKVVGSLLPKLASGSSTAPPYRHEAEAHVGIIDSVGELFQTHPLEINRFRLANEFWQSQEFLRARRKIQRRQRVLGGLVPTCRFCGQSKQLEELFCLKCGKCQT
jgi:Zn-dependent protease with chaperone function